MKWNGVTATDGKLYASVGENANPSHAQTLANRHGKMLRINPDGTIAGIGAVATATSWVLRRWGSNPRLST